MSLHDHTALDIERMANAATDDVMEKLHHVVRQAVMREVAEELADQRAQLDEERARLERMAQAKDTPLKPTRDLITAAGRASKASAVMIKARFTPTEKSARQALDNALSDLRSVYSAYATIMSIKGN